MRKTTHRFFGRKDKTEEKTELNNENFNIEQKPEIIDDNIGNRKTEHTSESSGGLRHRERNNSGRNRDHSSDRGGSRPRENNGDRSGGRTREHNSVSKPGDQSGERGNDSRNRDQRQNSNGRRPREKGRGGIIREQDNGKKVKIIPIGGLDAIGRNITLIECDDTILIVDCGMMFPTSEMPGVDYIIPDFDYLIRNKHKVKGLVITHGHEDHIGGVPYLLQKLHVPIYGTKLTIGFIRSRLEDKPPAEKPEYNEIAPRETFQVGAFRVEFIRVNHSIADSVALAIKTPAGVIIHTGDFKIDHAPADGKLTDLYRFAEYGEQGVLLLMSDSTNAERPGYTGSENIIDATLADTFSNAKGRIILATFASNINRIQQVLDAAQKFNRKVVISGRSMLKNVEIAKTLGYLTFKDNLIVDLNEAKTIQDKKIVIICTGTQGEPMSALTRMANGTHKHFIIGASDRVIITASVIPGNERLVSSVINLLLKLGTDVYYEQARDIHVSGHASQEELKLMMALTKPKFFMPIHGEYKQLKAHGRLAESLGIRPSNIMFGQNGDVLTLSRDSFRKTDAFPIRNVFVDGTHIGDLDSDIIKDRQSLSIEGIIIATVVVQQGMLASAPEILMKGFAADEGDRIHQMLIHEVEHRFSRGGEGSMSAKEIQSLVKKSLKTLLYRTFMRDPIVEVIVTEI
jgi:ribonuclease J